MKNGDMPAMPMFDSNAKPCLVRGIGEKETEPASGLTKREMMAMHIMAGMFAADCVGPMMTDIATMAVTQADALLAELERTDQ